MPFDLTGNKVSLTYPRLVQYVSGSYYDGAGNPLNIGTSSSSLLFGTGSFATTGSNIFIGNQVVTGSVTASGFFGDLQGTASGAATASYLREGTNIYLSQSVITSVTGSTNPPFRPATLFWDDSAKTYAIYGDDPSSSLQIGQEQWLRVYAGEFVPNGCPVYISGSSGDLPVVKLALADGLPFSVKSEVVGVATNDIQSGSVGIITTHGQVHDLNTDQFMVGSAVYLSNINSGSIIQNYPPHPHEIVQIGYVVKKATVGGIIHVSTTNIEQNTYPFVGIHTLPSITTGSDGSVFVGTGSVNLSETIAGYGPVKNYQVPSASFIINTSSLQSQYIVATYNSGSPVFQLSTDYEIVDEIQTTLVYILSYRSYPGAISIIDYDESGNLLPNKLLNRTIEINGNERASGLVIGTSGSRYCTISSGHVWCGARHKILPDVNSGVNEMTLLRHSSSIVSSSVITQLTNTQCDNGTDLVNLGAGSNHWVSNYIYRGVENLNNIIVMYSDDFSGPDGFIDAQLGQPPEPPTVLTETTILVGRVIYQKGVDVPALVESAFTKVFTPSGITDHNLLRSLQGGSINEYYHLSSASYAQVSNGSSSYASNSENSISASFALNGFLNFSESIPTINISSEIAKISTGSYDGVFFDYIIKSGSNKRCGSIFGTWLNAQSVFTEVSTVDIGDTSQVTMSMDVSGSYIRLTGVTNLTNNWQIKTLVRYL